MYILGIHTGHDAGAALFRDQTLVAFCKEERLSRIKNQGGVFALASIDEVLRIGGIARRDVDVLAMTRIKIPLCAYKRTSRPAKDMIDRLRDGKRLRNLYREMYRLKTLDEMSIVDLPALRKELGLRADAAIEFCNHHKSHILGSLMFTDWAEGLYLSYDGGGDHAYYSAYELKDGQLVQHLGEDEILLTEAQNPASSIALAYAHATEICGFTPLRHEGKITGLAAFGKPTAAALIQQQFLVRDNGHIDSTLKDEAALKSFLQATFAGMSREDVAASIQVAAEEVTLDWIRALRKRYPSTRIALSGGLFANVRINQRVAELEGIEEIFIFPAMGDEGLPVGCAVESLVRRHGVSGLQRQRFKHLYYGFPYTSADLVDAADERFRFQPESDPALATARLVTDGLVGAIVEGAMEMGPRALGARTIVASPEKRETNDSINKRLDRTEFMPFAPYVRDVDAEAVFEIDERNRYACRFMTITTNVRPAWQEEIKAVVHVDGTARPQIVYRDDNPLYYDILTRFKELRGLPCLVNTSFNAHEEPIINTPHEALQALADNRIDFLVCDRGLIFRAD
ncbi:MAG: hypothetical protein IPH08_17000 [Rhodocyclaceae bacterium]|jgi:carbamoyltransferase|nr:hypothetical protein [Rhodocyclaceae bacterium]MBK6908696.1 hypothetical protein [Rhodocyclaceae bacterium]